MKPRKRDDSDLIGGNSVQMPRRAAHIAATEWEKVRIRRERANAEKIELQNAIARKEMLRAADVQAEWSTILTDVRAALLAIPSRLTDLDRQTVERVDREIRAALEALADV